jgi:hypothetical protein
VCIGKIKLHVWLKIVKDRALLFVTGEFEQEKQKCLHVMLLVVGHNITPPFWGDHGWVGIEIAPLILSSCVSSLSLPVTTIISLSLFIIFLYSYS